MAARTTIEGPRGPAPSHRIPHDVWAVSFTSLFSDWSYEMLLPILPFFLAIDLGASPLVVGLVEGLAVFAQSVSQFISGRRLAHRADRRRVGTAGYATTTVSHALIAAATAWPYAAVLRITAWVARGERQPIKKAILADASRTVGAGRSFGLEQMFDSLGAVAGTASAVAVVLTEGLSGFRTIFAISFVPGVIAVLLFYRLVWDRDSSRGSGASSLPSATPLQFPRRFKWFLASVAVFGLAFFNILLGLLRVGSGLIGSGGNGAVGGILVALVAYLVYNLVYTGISYPAGLLADRFPRIGLVAVGYLLFVPVDLLFIQTPSVVIALLAFLIAGVQIGLSDVAQSAWISRAVGPAEVGRAFGWFGAVQGVSSLGASVLIGALWTEYTAPLAFSVSAVLALAGTALLIPVALEPRSPTAG
jgi:MFS family permease